MPEQVSLAETASVGDARCFQVVKRSTHRCEDRDSNKAVGALREGRSAYRRAPPLGIITIWTVCSLFFSPFNRLYTFVCDTKMTQSDPPRAKKEKKQKRNLQSRKTLVGPKKGTKTVTWLLLNILCPGRLAPGADFT
ncbi:hypothetical protein NDU88_007217 [Pleurodeles waltl]|uniref:Uncharacterized protein n=1 Tax=Pleurodeles waltl TaxID=8319 RepID=A0AAV7U1M9_PLEWA|nr:hypothetical protein NDU88_007217 [Pleurodeles waltl]